MSSDNGYVIRKHPNGGFAAVDYCASIACEDGYDTPDGYPLATGREEQFHTIKAALDACANSTNWMEDPYYSEYGAHLDKDCRDIQDALLHELHEEVKNLPNWDTKQKCTCGEVCSNYMQLYKHQSDSLREQLKQLGGQ